jgi:hypothetical protein
MAEYRIVKMKGCESLYKVEKKFIGIWLNTYWQWHSFEECEWYILDIRKCAQIKKDNPRDIVIAEYK